MIFYGGFSKRYMFEGNKWMWTNDLLASELVLLPPNLTVIAEVLMTFFA